MHAYSSRFGRFAPLALSVSAPWFVGRDRPWLYESPAHCAAVQPPSSTRVKPGSRGKGKELKSKRAPRHLIQRTDVFCRFWSVGGFEETYEIETPPIGYGGFGTVYKGRLKGTDIIRAVKIIEKKDLSTSSAELENEVQSLLKLDHPHVVKLIRCYDEPEQMYLIFELCTGPDLFDAIVEASNSAERRMKEPDVAIALRHMLKAIKCCHNRYVGHYDVKPENFMYRSPERTNLKMMDLGSSSGFAHDPGLIKGTYDYFAPEIYQGVYGPEADVWSCGVILFLLLTGKNFFPNRQDLSEDDLRRLTNDRQWLFGRIKWASEQGISAPAIDLLGQMLSKDRHMRITVKEALAHPFVLGSYRHNLHSDQNYEQAVCVIEGLFESFRTLSEYSMLKRATISLMTHLVGCLDIMLCHRVAFRLLDAAGNGELSVDMLEQGLKRFNVKIPSDTDELFNWIDSDGDGYISFLDFLSATLPPSVFHDEANMKKVWAFLDRNGDGFIDAADLIDAFGCRSNKEIQMCYDAMREACSAADGISPKEVITCFLPKRLRGELVLKRVGSGQYRIDNSVLKSDAPFLAYRKSKELDDRASAVGGPAWGSIVNGKDEGEWIRVECKVDRLSYEDFLSHGS